MSLMEYALVNILMGDVVDGGVTEESALKKGMKSMFMTSGAPAGGPPLVSSSAPLPQHQHQHLQLPTPPPPPPPSANVI